jgi:hypothetical protein
VAKDHSTAESTFLSNRRIEETRSVLKDCLKAGPG